MIRKFSCYYKILKVSQKATKPEIKLAFYQLAKSYHPDTKGSSAEFKKIKQAYDTLMNDESRYQYDIGNAYLNAFDIDQMELNLKNYGSRYVSKAILSGILTLDAELERELSKPFEKSKLTFKSAGSLNDLNLLRVKFVVTLFGGFLITYNLGLVLLEAYIYPSSPSKILLEA